MEKAKYTPIVEYTKPKKTPTNFVKPSSTPSKASPAKSNTKSSQKGPNFIKKQDESWDY